MTFQCSKCEKSLSSKQSLKRHEEKCNGLKPTQCELCHKDFGDKIAKYKHKKNKVCERNGTMIDITGNHNKVHIDNSIHFHGPVNINFGDEKIKISKQLLQECVKDKDLNGILKLITNRYFNKPENHTIRKINKKDTFMDIKKDGKWVKSPANDVIEKILNKISEKPNQYLFDELERIEIGLREEESHKKCKWREQRSQFFKDIRNYAQKLQVLGYFYSMYFPLGKENAPSINEKRDMTEFLTVYDIPLEVGKKKATYKKQIREYLYHETKRFLSTLESLRSFEVEDELD